MKKLILEIYHQSKGIYGAPKIRQELLKKGHQIAEKTVGNYMRELGIRARYVRPYKQTTISSNFDTRLKNLIKEQYNPAHPNTIWCSDITYIWTERGFYYLTSIMDLFSRQIIAWRLSNTLESKWLIECVEEAKENRPFSNPCVLHSDRGTQYVSKAYHEALNGIQPSYSQKASPWQNACIESFHALIKREWLHQFTIRDYTHARQLIFEYIEGFYNTRRSHSHCAYLSPKEFEKQYNLCRSTQDRQQTA